MDSRKKLYWFLVLVMFLVISFLSPVAKAKIQGDAVYREGGFLNNLDHAGVYNSDGQVYEIRGYWYQGGDGVELSSWSRFLDGKSYYGGYCVPGTTSSKRNSILDTCDDMDNDTDITYTVSAALYHEDTGGRIDVYEITDVRCDGVVEYAFERNGVWVWGKADPPNSSGTPTHFDISLSAYCIEHEDLGGDEPWIELSPLVQRGGNGIAWTKLRQLPDLQPHQPSGWDDKLVISNVTGTNTSASVIYNNESIYVDFSCINSGEVSASSFRYGLYIDGNLRKYVNKSSLSPNYYSYVLDSDIGILSTGWHTFEIKCDYNTDIDEGSEENNEYSRNFYITAVPDTVPPSPNPMTWSSVPYESSTSTINMQATEAFDSSGPIYYQFDFTSSPTGGSGGADSLWQLSRSYSNTGLAANHQYGYRSRAKDSAPTQNTTGYSSPISYEYTDIETPSGITFGTITTSSIQVRSSNTLSGITRGSSGLIIFNVATGTDSGWKQNNDYWTSDSLSTNTQYEFKARARNGDGDPTDDSSSSYKYTLANAPEAASFSDITQSNIQANWIANGNPIGTEYLCENLTKGTNSGWTTNTYWDETGLNCGTQYCYQVRAKNGDGVGTTATNLGCETTLPCTVRLLWPAKYQFRLHQKPYRELLKVQN